MSNLALAMEKLEAARLILGAIDAYLATCTRLQGEARKLTDEAEQLVSYDTNTVKGDGDGTDQGEQQGQP